MGKHYHCTDNSLSTLPLVLFSTLHQAHTTILRHVTAKEVKKNNIKDKLQHLQQLTVQVLHTNVLGNAQTKPKDIQGMFYGISRFSHLTL